MATTILNSYVRREVMRPLAPILGILVTVFAAYSAATYLAKAAQGFLDGTTVTILVLLKTAIALETLLPVAFYTTVVIGLGRLHISRELIAMASCGFGHRRVALALAPSMIIVATSCAALSLWVRPAAYRLSYELRATAETELDFSRIAAERFYRSSDGTRVVFAEAIRDGGERLEGFFMWVDRGDTAIVMSAKDALSATDPATGRHALLLKELSGYEYPRAVGKEPRALSAAQVFYELPRPDRSGEYRRKAAPTLDLAGSGRPENIAEFQWRLARPLSAVLLALLAIRMGRFRPRGDKFGRFGIAAGCYLVYYQAGIMARNWAEDGRVPGWLGIWWVDGALALLLLLWKPRTRKA